MFLSHRYRRRKQNCPNCNYSWCENIKDSDMKLRKVRTLADVSQHESAALWTEEKMSLMETDVVVSVFWPCRSTLSGSTETRSPSNGLSVYWPNWRWTRRTRSPKVSKSDVNKRKFTTAATGNKNCWDAEYCELVLTFNPFVTVYFEKKWRNKDYCLQWLLPKTLQQTTDELWKGAGLQ